MTTEEAKLEKEKISKQILDLLSNFEKRSGLIISKVEIVNFDGKFNPDGKYELIKYCNLTITV